MAQHTPSLKTFCTPIYQPDDVVASSQPLEDGVDDYMDYMESVPSSQPFEDGDDYCPTYTVKPSVPEKTPPSNVGWDGLDTGLDAASMVAIRAAALFGSPKRSMSPLIRGHLIRRVASPTKTARSSVLRLDPPTYDAHCSRRLIRRTTALPTKKLLLNSSESSSHPPGSSGGGSSQHHQQRPSQSQRRARASHLLRKMHALEAKLARMKQIHSRLITSLSRSTSC
ncbi:hypothetical protein DFH09DRAFT_1285690, partial [Mycena vulgaris]